MKKCIFSAVAGALGMLLLLVIIANISAAKELEQKEYEHIDFVSDLSQEDCFVCGNGADFPVTSYWGENNIAR